MDTAPRIGRFRRSVLLLKAAWQAFKLDKEALILPLVAFVSIAPVMIAGMWATYYLASTAPVTAGETVMNFSITNSWPVVIASVVFVVINMLLAGALTAMALARFRGEDPTIKASFRAAWRRKWSLIGFGLLSFGIAQIVTEIAQRIPFLGGKIVAWIAGAAWNVASFFAVPTIMTEEKYVSPFSAVRQSAAIIRKTWGESLVMTATVGLVAGLTLVAYVVAVTIVVGMLVFVQPLFGLIAAGVGVLGLLLFAMVVNILDAYAKAAIYYYATTGISPLRFNKDLLRQTFSPKKARKLFV